MLKELTQVRQIEGESKRRWFADDFFDLIIWFDAGNEVIGFQLCYDITGDERALTWRKEHRYSHERIDQGDDAPGMSKATPILVKDGIFDYRGIAESFKNQRGELDEPVLSFIYNKIREYPA